MRHFICALVFAGCWPAQLAHAYGFSVTPRCEAVFTKPSQIPLRALSIVAINGASVVLTGYPVYLPRLELFQPPHPLSRYQVDRIIEISRRIVLAFIAGILIDDLLETFWPRWRVEKLKLWGQLSLESKTTLEDKAFKNWTETVAALTDEAVDLNSTEAIEVRKRLAQMSREELYLFTYRSPTKE